MDATKFVTVRDADGVLRSREVPDHSERRAWTGFYACMERLLPRNGDLGNQWLPLEAARFAHLEPRSRVEDEAASLSAPDRFQLSTALLMIQQSDDYLRKYVIAAKLGKSIEEFNEEVEQELAVERRKHAAEPETRTSPNERRNQGNQ